MFGSCYFIFLSIINSLCLIILWFLRKEASEHLQTSPTPTCLVSASPSVTAVVSGDALLALLVKVVDAQDLVLVLILAFELGWGALTAGPHTAPPTPCSKCGKLVKVDAKSFLPQL